MFVTVYSCKGARRGAGVVVYRHQQLCKREAFILPYSLREQLEYQPISSLTLPLSTALFKQTETQTRLYTYTPVPYMITSVNVSSR